MKHSAGKALITRIDAYLSDTRLDSEKLLRKRWAWIWLMVTFIGSALSGFFFLVVLGLWPLWWFATSFIAAYLIALPVYRRAQRFDIVLNILFSYLIVLSFFAMIQTGGLSSNLGFIFIGINCAMGSVLAGNLRWTIALFALYSASILLLGLMQANLSRPDYITDQANTVTFVSLALWINACILLLMIFFMKDHERFEKRDAKRLERLDEAKTHLYNNVSHEFRTPLTIIHGMADLLGKDPEKWSRSAPKRIKMQSRILLNLVDQLLDISKLRANTMPLNLQYGDIVNYVEYVSHSFYAIAETKGVSLTIESEKSSLNTLFDPEKLMQILTNILSNAFKHTPPGGHISVNTRVVTEKNLDEVYISVSDTGTGIPHDALPHIFDRFYQVHDRSNTCSGCGLGLALANELVRLMDGEIRVSSHPGEGSVFTVVLPLVEAKQENPEAVEFPAHTPKNLSELDSPNDHLDTPGNMPTLVQPHMPVLLLVEDNVHVMEYLQVLLAEQFTIDTARNGAEGLTKAREIMPDIILTDVMMPVMDGFEMIAHIRNDLRTDHIPIVVITARGDHDSKMTGIDEGADHYLVKPFDDNELLGILRNLLTARKNLQKRIGVLSTPAQQIGPSYRRGLAFLKNIHRILDEHLDNPDLNIQLLCSKLSISRPQLYRKFKSIANVTLGKYILTYRLYKAREMLQNQNKNVTEVALETGFKSVSHFSTAFRKEFGFSPKEMMV